MGSNISRNNDLCETLCDKHTYLEKNGSHIVVSIKGSPDDNIVCQNCGVPPPFCAPCTVHHEWDSIV